MNHNIKAVRAMAVTTPMIMLILNTGVVATLWFGGVQVEAGTLQVGQVVAFINYLTQTLMGLMMVSMLAMRVSRSEASAVRIHEVLDSAPKVINRPDALKSFVHTGPHSFAPWFWLSRSSGSRSWPISQ